MRIELTRQQVEVLLGAAHAALAGPPDGDAFSGRRDYEVLERAVARLHESTTSRIGPTSQGRR